MERTYQVEVSAERPATDHEKLTMKVNTITETKKDRVRAYDRTAAASKGKTLALKKWPTTEGWEKHSAVVM